MTLSILATTPAGSLTILPEYAFKESIKNIVSIAGFIFGLAAFEMCQLYREKTVFTFPIYPQWIQTANKITTAFAKISLILSAAVSRPGVLILSSILTSVFSSARLASVFGPYTSFAINPWHPRHVAGLIALLFALPAVIQTALQTVLGEKKWSCLHSMALFNVLTSRPVLHLGNHFAKSLTYR